MASLKATYSSESEIPDGAQSFYKEMADGEYKLQLDGDMKTQEDVDRAMNAMKKQKDKKIELQQTLSNYPDDFDPEKWDKVKNLDPDQDFSGDVDKDSQEFQNAVAKAVREKEQAIKEDYEDRLEAKEEEFNEKKQAINETYKENWIKQRLAEKFDFTDPKRLRWFMMDIKSGQHPALKKKLDSIEVSEENGQPKVVGGDLKDKQGAVEVLENIAQDEVTKDYRPASNNSGGDARNDGPSSSTSKKLSLFEKDDEGNLIGNRTERGNFIDENPDEARKLAKKAGWSGREINW